MNISGCQFLPNAEFYVAIDNKGLWPNLTLLPNGEIAAAVYNHPSHGYGSASDVELWVSADEGRTWQFRSTVSDRSNDPPNAIRMNHAIGLNAKGELVALVSGYHEGQKKPLLPVQVCVSGDNGMSWSHSFLEDVFVPFGDIFIASGGCLVCPANKRYQDKPARSLSFICLSQDNGKTWSETRPVAKGFNETNIIVLKNGVWLATARSNAEDRLDGVLPHGDGQFLFRSEDEGRTWSSPKKLSPQGQENAHLLELADGRILCAFTSRIPGLFGVVMRISEDNGETWSVPASLVTIPASDWHKTDAGYPSSVEMPDGTIVTAFYFGPKKPEFAAHAAPWHQRYHMGVARWNIKVLLKVL